DRWSKPVCNAPSNLGPPQLGGFFPVAARVFQIQSVFVPVHEPLLVRWPFRSNHSVYLRGKIPHPRAPNSVVNGCLAGFPRAEHGATHSRQAEYTPQRGEILLDIMPGLHSQSLPSGSCSADTRVS